VFASLTLLTAGSAHGAASVARHPTIAMPNDVSASSPTDVWISASGKPPTWHWNGAAWEQYDIAVPSNRDWGGAGVGPIKAIAPDDVWAVGPQYRAVSYWDGTHWRLTGYLPNPTGLTLDIWGIDGSSDHDVWVVGSHTTEDGGTVPMIWHWDGASWTERADVPAQGGLHAVVEVSPEDAWAVGSDGDEGLVLHWDGASWSRVDTGASQEQLSGVGASGPDDVWIVGIHSSAPYSSFAEHWDGRSWSVVPSVNTHKPWNYYTGVSVLSPTDAWAVGFGAERGDSWGFPRHNLVAHWDGRAWTRVHTPHPGNLSYLGDVSADAANDVWAVGASGEGFSKYFLLQWDGQAWHRMWIH
jgi:hypothetical protein